MNEEYKGYVIKPTLSLVAYEVEYMGRGSEPRMLRGLFTDRKTARRFIDVYLEGKEDSGGKAVSSRRSKQVQRGADH